VADVVMPALVDAVDIDEALGRIDIDELLAHVDIDALVSRIDMQALMERLDLNRLLEKVDLDALTDRIGLARLFGRLDLNALLDTVDVDRLLERVDVDEIVQRVDVTALVLRVDVNEVVQAVDVNALVQRVDVNALVQEVDLGAITGKLVTGGTEGLLTSFLDLVRRQVVGLDVVLLRVVDGLLRRQPGTLQAGPDLLTPAGAGAASSGQVRGRYAGAGASSSGQVSGRYAGPVSRLLAFTLDIGLILALFAVGTSALNYLIRLLTGYQLERNGTNGTWWTVALVLWALVYLWIGPAVAGRTIGMALVGLRVVAADGSPLSQRQSLVRVLLLPLSIALLGLGFVMAVVSGRRQALHDAAARTCVVYDWGDRPAEMPAPLTKWLSRRGAIDVVPAPPAQS
jgi:uncharacterized RDD family membrane protein YckC